VQGSAQRGAQICVVEVVQLSLGGVAASLGVAGQLAPTQAGAVPPEQAV
jgi:hypothetical protein